MKYGFAANAEKLWYGLSPQPVGPIGRICQKLWPARFRKSMKRNDSSPRFPIPYGEGILLTGSRIPLVRIVSPSFK